MSVVQNSLETPNSIEKGASGIMLNLQEKDNELEVKDKTIKALKRELTIKDDIIKSLNRELDKFKSVLQQATPETEENAEDNVT